MHRFQNNIGNNIIRNGNIHNAGVWCAKILHSVIKKRFFTTWNAGLINSGMFRYTRNPNYLGEMLVYGGFGLLVKHYWIYLVLTVAWGVMFNLNMYLKDHDSLKFKVVLLLSRMGGSTIRWAQIDFYPRCLKVRFLIMGFIYSL